MIDFKALVLDPVHDLLHPTATLTLKSGEVVTCTANDLRDGVNVYAARGKQSVLVPGVTREEENVVVRQSQCPTSPDGATFQFDGETQQYIVRSVLQKGTLGRGEWVMTLEKKRPT